MPRHHVIITGTGRAGTTFLMQLLTELRFDTGFRDIYSAVSPNCNAGMERNLLEPDAPYIVKSPYLCDTLDHILEEGGIVIDHALVPVRELHAAAESRRQVASTSDPGDFDGIIPGGLWHTDEPEAQENVLAHELYKLVHALARHDVPTTWLYFPRFIHDPDYLWKKAAFVFRRVRYATFLRAFRKVCRPELVHNFTASARVDR